MFHEFKQAMFKKFEMTDFGIMSFFLGIEVRQQPDDIFICQKKYAKELLDKFNIKNCNAVNTPIAMDLKLTREREGKIIDPTLFRSLIGSLRYLPITRPDIVYSVGLLSRYMEKPKESHWLATKRILRYIKGTVNLVFYIPIIMMPHYMDIQIVIAEVIKMKGKVLLNMFSTLDQQLSLRCPKSRVL